MKGQRQDLYITLYKRLEQEQILLLADNMMAEYLIPFFKEYVYIHLLYMSNNTLSTLIVYILFTY